MADNTGSMSFAISSGEDYEDNAFVSFMTNGEAGMDNADAYKLLPMSPSDRVVVSVMRKATGWISITCRISMMVPYPYRWTLCI